MAIKLSILILSLPSRIDKLKLLLYKLDMLSQGKPVEILVLTDNKSKTIGKKRNDLLNVAQGEYITFIDDDDDIENSYIDDLLQAIDTNADVITFQVKINIKHQRYIVKYSKDYINDFINQIYYRQPNHLMCWNRYIAQQIGYEDENWGEDTKYGEKINKLIKTEYNIPKPLYFYYCNPQESEAYKRYLEDKKTKGQR